MELISKRSGRFIVRGRSRLSPQPVGRRRAAMVLLDDFLIPVGQAIVSIEGIRTSFFYNVDSGQFVWESLDGMVNCVNEVAFSGAEPVPTGHIGTTITRIINSEPLPTTGYRRDEVL